MKSLNYFSALLLVSAVASCSLLKKTNKDSAAMPVINLDTIEKIASATEPKQYRATATRLSDIIHTKLEVSFDFPKRYMYGKATITAKPYFYPSSTLVLNARGMEIKEVDLMVEETVMNTAVKQDSKKKYEPAMEKRMVKKPLKYEYANDLLNIQLDREYKSDEAYMVFIDYISKPNEIKKGGGGAAITDDKGLYFINPDGKEKDKPTEIWTQGETESSSVWFPTIDHPNERMTQEIYITVNKKYVTLSNGELVSSFDNGDTTRTDYWRMDLPHAPYLAMMAIGEFSIVKDKWRDREVNYYVEKAFEPYAKAIFGHTPEMIEFFSTKLGVPYAWNKYAQIVVRDYVSGAMENTTATLHGEFLQRTDRELLDRSNEDVISHELFHQWFGDLVTCESWSNLPLNESFATYGEYLWDEYKYGRDAADYISANSRAGYLSEASRKQVPLIRFQYEEKDDMFDGHSYNKGGQVLHMLRKYVGDDAFFASLKLYLETNKFSSAEIHQLRLAFEQTTGEDLNWFFNQWFLSPGHPDLVIKSEYDSNTKKEIVNIKQVQDLSKTPLFRLPMFIDVYVNGKVERKTITINKSDETFYFDEATQPDLVNVDAEKQLLCTKKEIKSVREWAFQYRNAPLFLDRKEALGECIKELKDTAAAAVLLAAIDDKFWSLRETAIEALKGLEPGHEADIKNKLIKHATRDDKSEVRATAIEYLSAKYTDEDLQAVYKNALNDQSYMVLGAALNAYVKANPKDGMAIAKRYETEKSKDVLYAIASLYAKYGTDENNGFYLAAASQFTGFAIIGFVKEYTAFLKGDKSDESVNAGTNLFASIARDEDGIKWVKYYAKKSIFDLMNLYEDQEHKLDEQVKKLSSETTNPSKQELEKQLAKTKAEHTKLSELYGSLK